MSSSPHTLAASGGAPTASPATEVLSTYFVPGATVIQPCKITGHQRAYRVLSSPHRVKDEADKDNAALASYSLSVECLGLIPQEPVAADNRRAVPEYRIGRVQTSLSFQVDISGVRDIRSLSVYPIEHHPSENLKLALIARGKVWADVSSRGVQLSQFTGQEVRLTFTFDPDHRTPKEVPPPKVAWKRSRVDSDVVLLDHGGYFAMNPQAKELFYEYLEAKQQTSSQETVSRDDLLLAPTVVYGYSVSKRRWAAYNVHGDFLYYSKDMVEHKCDLYLPPKITGADFAEFSMTRTHAWINSLSRGVIRQDGQGLLLMLHGDAAETTAVSLAGAYGRDWPQRTFSVKRLSTISSELDSLRKAISSNAVITIHKDDSGDLLSESVISILRGEDLKCIVLLVLPKWHVGSTRSSNLERKLYADSNLSIHCVGLWYVRVYLGTY